MAEDNLKSKVIEFLSGLDASPDDSQVHDFATENNFEVSDVEAMIYSLAFNHVKSGMEKQTEASDAVDTITVDVPLITRLFEFFSEGSYTDMQLHDVLTNLINESKTADTLTMDNYDAIVKLKDEEPKMERLRKLHEQIMRKEAMPSTDAVQKFCWSDVKSVDSVKVMGKQVIVNYTVEYTEYDGKKTSEKRSMEFTIEPQDSYVKTEDVQKLFNQMINGK